MIKHIGKSGDQKVAIVFREVPDEEHMALVIYPDLLPMSLHDPIMKVIEGVQAQEADSLGDVFFRTLLPDGRPILQTLHSEGMMKKVATRNIIVTPTPTSSVVLEEMNNIIRKMEQGEEAQRELAELDAQSGMTGTVRQRDDFGREVGAPNESVRAGAATVAGSDAALAASSNAGALDDAALAETLTQQATRMEVEAKQLIAESKRLMKEAKSLAPKKTTTTTRKSRTTKAKVANETST